MGVPVVAVDPAAGGAKIKRQARKLEWPAVFNVDDSSDEALQEAFDYCLSEQARAKAVKCYKQATEAVYQVRDQFVAGIGEADRSSRKTLPDHPQRWLRDQWYRPETHNFAEGLQVSQRQHYRRALRLQELRAKNRQLACRVRILEQKVYNVKNSNAWKVLRYMSQVRDAVLGNDRAR